ncbi:MAG: aminotransferase class I/II-fold pyridoxal phosphate-dependent enzyme [Planctomycetes bacterium]|nr:aminotransferase class I/II-fold pyridoxal phosphate-dependent enzyme [Planctomycetota bacterium]
MKQTISQTIRSSLKAQRFTESVIREMTRIANQHQAINLAQGFPDFPAPMALKEAAVQAIRDDINQYAVTWGAPRLRQAIAEFMQTRRGVSINADEQVTVVCGGTEGMVAAMMGILDPGDEVLIPEPFYENYGPDGILTGANPVFVPMGPNFALDVTALQKAITPKTRAVVINTPHNPTGRVFTAQEMQQLYDMVIEHDLLLFTDEIYEEILFTGPHQCPLLAANMAERTIVVSGASKTYSVTGWRIGWVITPPALTGGVRRVHDFLTVGAAAPLQEAIADALTWGDAYYEKMRAEYMQRREVMVNALQQAGFSCSTPEGAYYIMADVSDLQNQNENDTEFAMRLITQAGVATVPGSSFYQNPEDGKHLIRFCYAKQMQTLQEAGRRLLAWRERSI